MNIEHPANPVRTLLVGSDGESLEILAGKFPGGSVVGLATNHGRALDMLESRRPQVVIIDSHPGELEESLDFAWSLQEHTEAAFLLLLPQGPIPDGAPAQSLSKPLLDAELALAVRMAIHCRQRDTELERSQRELTAAQRQLAETEQKLAALGGLLSLCTYCHHTRNESGEWEALHHYLSRRVGVAFSHGVCACCEDAQRAENGLP